jgi:hypothetical protein
MLFFCFRKLTGFFLDEISAALILLFSFFFFFFFFFYCCQLDSRVSSYHIKEEQVRTWLYGKKEKVPLFNWVKREPTAEYENQELLSEN